jgi:transcriptional regulator with XRE-family HTH domain
MDLKENLATNLRRLRNEAGHTQEELADRASISFRYLGAIERGKVSASITSLGKLADALSVDPCKLIRDPNFK